ncbi:sensor histidine kinase [Proteiniphilum sp. UBA5384]|uniref:sensor histidine kinase n=1 Tax=Proteiniphilum sp. UBA5384 TaxID=1947279 RepID=UPI0025E0311F|nr:HAMP domain-containing sensor histidine kinase [Proteiniphilum sp. UBA5384]
MKWNFRTILIASALALSVLLLSQGIWIRNSMSQRKENRTNDFQSCFNNSITNVINELLGKDDNSPFKIEQLDHDVTIGESTSQIHMDKPSASESASRLLENALILLLIEEGNFSLSPLDSLINNCITTGIGEILSADLTLQDSENLPIDSITYTAGHTGFRSSKLYVAERVLTSLDRTYTIRAEYRIAQPANLRNMGIATLVSLLASIAVISILSYLLYVIRQRHNQIQNMERSFHGAIHDLKAPLAYVYFLLSSLEEEEMEMEKRESLSLTAEKVSSLTGKINRFLQSKKEIKQILKKGKKRFFLYDMTKQIEVEITIMFPHKEILFHNEFDAELSIAGSPDHLEAVLRILLENAVKYNNKQPEVAIRSWRDEENIVIEIEDNGNGIPHNVVRKLFKPYYTTDNEHGTGIGLYYAKSIIKAHGGNISVNSVVGKGSTFTITLPNTNR